MIDMEAKNRNNNTRIIKDTFKKKIFSISFFRVEAVFSSSKQEEEEEELITASIILALMEMVSNSSSLDHKNHKQQLAVYYNFCHYF